ncbi:hypothetical protein [Streptomyces sp. FH025]|uniref:hypothetical protein n=1 Tax=Streptomyces sp. FH025 TaxID=2815937 RepID=UPI001A9CE6AC|nr:hypothetical protein [Streptomyces sp. FH025]MBO1418536.1 hypothetical protein [Streptomyces sp. FH025]
MRPMRTAAAALIGATVLTGLTAPLASARDSAASVSPSQAAPGQTVTVTVSCEKSDKPDAKTITAHSAAFDGGPATLTLGSDGKHSGSARLASQHTGDNKVDGTCPDGGAFSTAVKVATVAAGGADRGPGDRGPADKGLGDKGLGDKGPADKGLGDKGFGDKGLGDKGLADKGLGEWGKAAGEWAGSLGQSGAGSQQVAPHGAVETGFGGSVAADPGELAAGLALVAGGVGGFWLLRRRGA